MTRSAGLIGLTVLAAAYAMGAEAMWLECGFVIASPLLAGAAILSVVVFHEWRADCAAASNGDRDVAKRSGDRPVRDEYARWTRR